jgi:hypothetical protein
MLIGSLIKFNIWKSSPLQEKREEKQRRIEIKKLISSKGYRIEDIRNHEGQEW